MSEWASTKDPKTGKTYYYNKITKQVQWTKPADLENAPSEPELPPAPAASTTSTSSPTTSAASNPFLARAQKFGLHTDVEISDLPPPPVGFQKPNMTSSNGKPDAKALVEQIKSSAAASAAAIAANPKLAGGPPPAGGAKSPVFKASSSSSSSSSSSTPSVEPISGAAAVVVKANPFARVSHAATTTPVSPKSIETQMASTSIHEENDDPPPAFPDDDSSSSSPSSSSPKPFAGLGMAKDGLHKGTSDVKPFAYAGNSVKNVVLKKVNRDIYEPPKPTTTTTSATIQTSGGAKNISKFTTKTETENAAGPIAHEQRAKDPLYSTPLPIDKTTGGALFSWREPQNVKEPLGTCDKCGGEIMDKLLDALGQTFHAECFVCAVCCKTLAGDILTVNDDYYHPSCMRCTVCDTQLSSQQFTVHPETRQLYCVKHARQAVAPSGAGEDGRIQCGSCSQSILPGQEIVKEPGGRSFHADCMKCAHCHAPLAGTRCYTHNGKQYCEVDYNDLFVSSCHHCHKAIDGSCMQVDDGDIKLQFHAGCFICYHCRESLRNQSFFIYRGQVYCERDYDEISNR